MNQVTEPRLQSRWLSSINKWLLMRLMWIRFLCVDLFTDTIGFWARVQVSAKCTLTYFCSGFVIFLLQWAKVRWCHGLLPLIQDVVFHRTPGTSIHVHFPYSPVDPRSSGGNWRSCGFLQNLHHSEKVVIGKKPRTFVLPTLRSALEAWRYRVYDSGYGTAVSLLFFWSISILKINLVV